MANYKPQSQKLYDVGGYNRPLQSGDISTIIESTAGNTTVRSLDIPVGTAYQVPSGKKLKIIGVQVYSAAAVGIFLDHSATADTSGTLISYIVFKSAGEHYVAFQPEIEVVADKYLSTQLDGSIGTKFRLFGVETDA